MTAETLNVSHSGHTATLLFDGRVLVVSGNTSEIFDPLSGTWTATAEPPNANRSEHSATLLADGRVLVAEEKDPVLSDTSEYSTPRPDHGFGPAKHSMSAVSSTRRHYSRTARCSSMAGGVSLYRGQELTRSSSQDRNLDFGIILGWTRSHDDIAARWPRS